jgi:hypothetical protein
MTNPFEFTQTHVQPSHPVHWNEQIAYCLTALSPFVTAWIGLSKPEYGVLLDLSGFVAPLIGGLYLALQFAKVVMTFASKVPKLPYAVCFVVAGAFCGKMMGVTSAAHADTVAIDFVISVMIGFAILTKIARAKPTTVQLVKSSVFLGAALVLEAGPYMFSVTLLAGVIHVACPVCLLVLLKLRDLRACPIIFFFGLSLYTYRALTAIYLATSM